MRHGPLVENRTSVHHFPITPKVWGQKYYAFVANLCVNVGSGRLDQKGHRKPFRDIGHNWVADTSVEDYDKPVSFLVGSGQINPRVIEGNRMSDRVRIQSIGITRGNSEVKPSQESIYVINATLRRIKERRGVVMRQERRGVVVTRKDRSELPHVSIGFAIVDGVLCGPGYRWVNPGN
ncbi:hypothetical protein C8R44DRAFT_727110 [Mycena epipterygia]|nr:hypothetical protein C8R44DRAFT_727110 [Mycena epipterygia]